MCIRKAARSQICYCFDLKNPSRYSGQALAPFDPDGHREGNSIRIRSRFCFNSLRALMSVPIFINNKTLLPTIEILQ